MKKRTVKTIIAAEGADYRIEFQRGEGYTLYFRDGCAGTFDRLQDALNERNRLAYDLLQRAA